MTSSGRRVWKTRALPEIHAYYEHVLADFSSNDLTHMLHYLLKLLENMKRVDEARADAGADAKSGERLK
jgi:hypothetical protein